MALRFSPSTINWLFFDPVNVDSLVHSISADPFKELSPGQLRWSDSISSKFKFDPDPHTIRFWQVTHRPQSFCFPHLTSAPQPIVPLPIKSVDRNWVGDHPSIDDIARFYQPALPFLEAIEGYWDTRQVHFLITAKPLVDG